MSNLDFYSRILSRFVLINFFVLAALTPMRISAQETRGTVKTDSLQVYRAVPNSQRAEPSGTLLRDEVVGVDWSLFNSKGNWCSVYAIHSREKLGYVDCNALEMKTTGGHSSAPSGIVPHSHSWTRAQKEWALAASGVLSEFNHERHDTLAGRPLTAENQRADRELLRKWWDINNREELIAALTWIENGGHRQEFSNIGERVSALNSEDASKLLAALPPEDANTIAVARRYYPDLGQKGITGWDYARYISLCRWGYLAGYLSEDEAWEDIMSAAHTLQSAFNSWQELGENYLIGREFWSARQTKIDGARMRAAYTKLVNDPGSPWNRIPWSLSLD